MIRLLCAPQRLVAFAVLLFLPATASADITVHNKSKKPVWVACGYSWVSPGAVENTFMNHANFAGGWSIAPGETKVIVKNPNITTAWLHLAVTSQSFVPSGAASFVLDKKKLIQRYDADTKENEWIVVVPKSADFQCQASVLDAGAGDWAKTLAGQSLSELPPSGHQVPLKRGVAQSITKTIADGSALAFFKINPKDTFVYNGEAPQQPASGKPLQVSFKNEHNKKVTVAVNSDMGLAHSATLAPGEARSFTIPTKPGFTPSVSVTLMNGGSVYDTVSAGNYAIRVDAGKPKIVKR